MAARKETRTLRERAQALRRSTTALINRVEGQSSQVRRRDQLAFMQLLRQTKALANVARSLRPNDLAWRYYDEDIAKIKEYLERGRGQLSGLSGYAIYELRKALEMIEGSLSRTRHPRLEEIKRLASAIFYSSDRYAARAVLADLLEETGYIGEANSLRKATWATDQRTLKSLGITPPRFRPYIYEIAHR